MFFDLSIPVGNLTSSSSSSKTQTLKTLARIMEPPPSTSPSRASCPKRTAAASPFSPSTISFTSRSTSSATFQSRRAGVTAASPFRQYTRVTVSIDKANFDKAFKCKGVLKSYDLVAAKPLDQTGFDTACQLSDRGVFFEIKYSTRIADVQIRRQMLSEAKGKEDETGCLIQLIYSL